MNRVLGLVMIVNVESKICRTEVKIIRSSDVDPTDPTQCGKSRNSLQCKFFSVKSIYSSPSRKILGRRPKIWRVRTCLRICGMEIIVWKNQKKFQFVRNGNIGPMRERALTEITKKISKNSEKIPICPKWQHWSDERERGC